MKRISLSRFVGPVMDGWIEDHPKLTVLILSTATALVWGLGLLIHTLNKL